MNGADRDDTSSSDAEKRLTTVASIMQGLHGRLMSHLDNHRTSSLHYRPCDNSLEGGRKPWNTRFSILDEQKTLELCSNMSISRLKVAIRTCPHPEKHCIICWWLMLSPPCGPSAINHMNCLLIASKRCHQNCYCIAPNVLRMVETTAILIVIDAVCQVSKSLEIRHNVIMLLSFGQYTPLCQARVLISGCRFFASHLIGALVRGISSSQHCFAVFAFSSRFRNSSFLAFVWNIWKAASWWFDCQYASLISIIALCGNSELAFKRLPSWRIWSEKWFRRCTFEKLKCDLLTWCGSICESIFTSSSSTR